MIKRCTNPNFKRYQDYGGRGIKVCDRWMDFANFYADMGDAPPGMSIDRIDNDGDYTPENCRWATTKQQCNNKRNNRILTLNGVSLTATQWCERIGLSQQTLASRLRAGWPVERALTEPAFIGKNQTYASSL
jgi:hypothetical protein